METRLVLSVALLVAACGGPRLVPYSPLERKTSIDEKKLYEAAEGTLLDKGYLIETRDESARLLKTEPRTLLGSEIAKEKYKYVFVVETRGGTLKIELKCESDNAASGVGPCGKEAPDKLVMEQRAIADAAIAEAKGK